MSYKTIDALMRHLRDNGIAISGSAQKRRLLNTGYFHGYKGYRFFRHAGTRLPFTSYDEIYATLQYDSALKALFYSKVMFIETAVKSIALEGILAKTKSPSIQDMFTKAISSYQNAPQGLTEEQKRKLQQSKLNLQKKIRSSLAGEYGSQNPKITHFYNSQKYIDVPLWALFEIMMMGDFGNLLSCLTFEMRDNISRRLGLNLASDTNRQLVYKYIYILKDLRNAIAHNSVVFDTRFRRFDPSKAMRQCLENEFNLPYIGFKSIDDYVVLICYYLKILKVPRTEIKTFIRNFEKITTDYSMAVNPHVVAIVIRNNLDSRMLQLKNNI